MKHSIAKANLRGLLSNCDEDKISLLSPSSWWTAGAWLMTSVANFWFSGVRISNYMIIT